MQEESLIPCWAPRHCAKHRNEASVKLTWATSVLCSEPWFPHLYVRNVCHCAHPHWLVRKMQIIITARYHFHPAGKQNSKKWFLMLEGNWYICALLVGIWIAAVLGEKSVAVSSNEKHACHQQSGERAPLGVEYRPKPYIVWAPQVLVVFYFWSGSGHIMLYW